MREFFKLLFKFDINGLFIVPTNNGFLQFFRYAFVGGIATVVDCGILFLLTDFVQMYHLISAVIAFILGLITNFLLSKLLVFKTTMVNSNIFVEFMGCSIIGVIGLGLTELIMFLFTNCLNLHYMLSKAVAAIIVLLWNYIARKIFIYNK